MKNVLSVGIGGVLGTLARYYMANPLNEPYWFPLGTLAVNLLGSFLLAFLLTVTLGYAINAYLVLGMSTGFMGSLTTFSALSVEFVTLAQLSSLNALAYVGSSIVLGLLLALVGRLLGKQLLASLPGKQKKYGKY
jgi:CrcB protein